DWTCSVGIMTGTHRGPMPGPGGSEIPATNRIFRLEVCTVAHWKNGEIIEERLFYDPTAMMQQPGLAAEYEGGAGCDPELSSMGRRR
ncbi:MAG: ester cyclase, partial [Methanomicrobiales archaeon]|nr:ester cyclase [Methanomicrobiales archaeon]